MRFVYQKKIYQTQIVLRRSNPNIWQRVLVLAFLWKREKSRMVYEYDFGKG